MFFMIHCVEMSPVAEVIFKVVGDGTVL